uniref:Uncharacterized protein n=1 Tax=Pyxicephalus adspersus TaxID=30357 RepID=A0AAV3A6W8_PYXAD|nr:TPA: hypothetical protein GDO54_013856 [Pyxicephalus adspersus]
MLWLTHTLIWNAPRKAIKKLLIVDLNFSSYIKIKSIMSSLIPVEKILYTSCHSTSPQDVMRPSKVHRLQKICFTPLHLNKNKT